MSAKREERTGVVRRWRGRRSPRRRQRRATRSRKEHLRHAFRPRISYLDVHKPYLNAASHYKDLGSPMICHCRTRIFFCSTQTVPLLRTRHKSLASFITDGIDTTSLGISGKMLIKVGKWKAQTPCVRFWAMQMSSHADLHNNLPSMLARHLSVQAILFDLHNRSPASGPEFPSRQTSWARCLVVYSVLCPVEVQLLDGLIERHGGDRELRVRHLLAAAVRLGELVPFLGLPGLP